jgi:cbb3-type cytochrome oxidase maturation protein
MESLWILIPLSLAIAVGIGAIFWWAVDAGQMDDLDSPGRRILIDNDRPPATDAATRTAQPAAQDDSAGSAGKTPPPHHGAPVV